MKIGDVVRWRDSPIENTYVVIEMDGPNRMRLEGMFGWLFPFHFEVVGTDDNWQPAAGTWMAKPITEITVTIPIQDAQRFALHPGIYARPIQRIVDKAVKEAEGTFGANIVVWDPGKKVMRDEPRVLDTTDSAL